MRTWSPFYTTAFSKSLIVPRLYMNQVEKNGETKESDGKTKEKAQQRGHDRGRKWRKIKSNNAEEEKNRTKMMVVERRWKR